MSDKGEIKVKTGVLTRVETVCARGGQAKIYYALKVTDLGGFDNQLLLFTEGELNYHFTKVSTNLDTFMELGHLYNFNIGDSHLCSYVCRIYRDVDGWYDKMVVTFTEAMLERARARANKALVVVSDEQPQFVHFN